MTADFAGLNEACLAEFGQPFTFTRAATGESLPIVAIPRRGPEPEDGAPADGSVYATIWLRGSDIVPEPDEGDEVAGPTTVYKFVRLERDEAGGMFLLLRKDRVL